MGYTVGLISFGGSFLTSDLSAFTSKASLV